MLKFRYSLVALALLPTFSFGVANYALHYQQDEELYKKVEESQAVRRNKIQSETASLDAKYTSVGQAILQGSAAVSSYEESQRVIDTIKDIGKELSQGSSLCDKVLTGGKFNAFNKYTSKAAAVNGRSVHDYLPAGSKSENELSEYDNNIKEFCSENDVAKGLCTSAVSGNAQNGDVNVALLFGTDASVTRDQDLDSARDAIINHLTGASYAPEPFGTTIGDDGKETLINNENAKRYENYRERYAAISMLGNDAIFGLSENHTYDEIEINDYTNTISFNNVSAPLANAATEEIKNDVEAIGEAYSVKATRVAYKQADGSYIYKVGGTAAWRHNNTGNISCANKSYGFKTLGAIGVAKPSLFCIFPSPEAGRRALAILWAKDKHYRNKTIAKAMESYAPKHENNTAAYVNKILKDLNIDRSTKFSDLSDEKKEQLYNTIGKVEGWKEGKIEKDSTSE